MRWFSSRAPKQQSLHDVAARHQEELLNEEAIAVRELLRLWASAYREISKRRKSVMRRIQWAKNNGVEPTASWLYQEERWRQYQATLRELMGWYSDRAATIVKSRQKASVEMAGRHVEELVSAAGVETGFIRLPNEAFERLVGFLRDGSPLREIFDSLGPLTVQRTVEVMTTGLLLGDNPREIARELQAVTDFSARRSLTIARQESLRAYRTTLQDNYRANDDVVSGWRWMSAKDGRTCPICIAMDGTEHPNDEEFASHIACRCSPTPIVKYRPVTRQTGEQWLRAQPAAKQRDILGPSRYELWKSGQVELANLVKVVDNPTWGPSRKLKTLDELSREISGGAE